MKHVESKIQIACVQWFNYNYPQYGKLLFHVPNGGQRSKITAAILKREGVVAGVADLILLVPNDTHHGLCIEMKTAKGRQTDNQKYWEQLVIGQGYQYSIVRDLESFIKLVNEYIR
jgi:hypothetical protein